jgi:ubiquinone/menaquinone biosynthesis C-methylase UbiE
MAVWDDVADRVSFAMPAGIVELRRLVPPDARILELGCGSGRIVSELQRAGFSRVIVRHLTAMIDRGRDMDASVDLRLMLSATVPEPDGSIDAVVLCALLTSIPDHRERAATMQEVRRVLRRCGILHAVESLRSPGVAYGMNGVVVSSLGVATKHSTREELSSLLDGFQELRAEEVSFHSLSGRPCVALELLASRL